MTKFDLEHRDLVFSTLMEGTTLNQKLGLFCVAAPVVFGMVVYFFAPMEWIYKLGGMDLKIVFLTQACGVWAMFFGGKK